jgi:hypothetical protein
MSGSTNRTVGFFWRSATSASGRVLPPTLVLRLQRTVGNREVTRLLLARHSGVPGEPSRTGVVEPVWMYFVAAVTGALIGIAIAIIVGTSMAVSFEIAVGMTLVAVGVMYLTKRFHRSSACPP